jgi:hypothetical protein
VAASLSSEQIPAHDHKRSNHGAGCVASPASSRPLVGLLDQRLQLILFRRVRWRLDGHDPRLCGAVAFSRP